MLGYAFAAEEEFARRTLRHRFAQLVELAGELSGAEPEQLDDFFRHGMALNVAAALGVEELSVGCPWVKLSLAEPQAG